MVNRHLLFMTKDVCEHIHKVLVHYSKNRQSHCTLTLPKVISNNNIT